LSAVSTSPVSLGLLDAQQVAHLAVQAVGGELDVAALRLARVGVGGGELREHVDLALALAVIVKVVDLVLVERRAEHLELLDDGVEEVVNKLVLEGDQLLREVGLARRLLCNRKNGKKKKI
jgi:hypothetical protein